MKTLLWAILTMAVLNLAAPQCCGAQAPRQLLPDEIKLPPAGFPPWLEAEIARAGEAFNKADKPARDALIHALELRDAGDISGAEAACRKALSLAFRVNGHLVRPEIHQLLGELLLRQGTYQEALGQFDRWIAERKHTKFPMPLEGRYSNEACVQLDLALAYCLRGNYQLALKYYTDPMVPATPPFSSLNDQPWEEGLSTRNLTGLKAAVLVQIALNPGSATTTEKEALRCMLEAAKLAPDNPMVAYVCGHMLLRKNRLAEALPYFRLAAKRGHGEVALRAKQYAGNLQYMLDHPQQYNLSNPDR
jgi:tetratricopeptide (TPR) repeat protein